MKGKALVAVIGVFLLGLVGGAVLGELYPGHDRWNWRADLGFIHKRPHRGSKRGGGKQQYIRILAEELDLSEKQMEEIRPMLDQARQKLYETRLASTIEYDQIILDLGESIRSSLDANQTQKLDQLTLSFRERRARKRERLQNRLEQLRSSQEAPSPAP